MAKEPKYTPKTYQESSCFPLLKTIVCDLTSRGKKLCAPLVEKHPFIEQDEEIKPTSMQRIVSHGAECGVFKYTGEKKGNTKYFEVDPKYSEKFFGPKFQPEPDTISANIWTVTLEADSQATLFAGLASLTKHGVRVIDTRGL